MRSLTAAALLGAAFLCFCAAAGADMEPVGRVPDLAKLHKLYARQPARLRSVPVRVEFKRNLAPLGRYFAPWEGQPALIQLRETTKATFLHELGHHLHLACFTEAERVEWAALWREHRRELPSDYARTNPAEGFAEVYQRWARQFRVARPFREFVERGTR